MASAAVPSGLLRSPGSVAGIEDPLGRETARRNRYRKPSVTVKADGITVEPVTSEDKPGVNTKRTRSATASSATIVGSADEKPRRGRLMTVSINSNLVFGGRVKSAQLNDAGILTVKAYDDTRRLLRTAFSNSYNNESLGQVVRDVARNAGVAPAVDNKFLALDQVKIDGEPLEQGRRRLVDESGQDALTGEPTTSNDGTSGGPDREYLTVTHDFKKANSAQILDDLAAAADALWWVGPRNILRFTDKPEITTHSINGITESQAGGQKLPYQKVVVVGASKKTPEGDRRRARSSKNPVRGVAGDKNAPEAQTYRSPPKRSIKTQQQANNVAKSVWKEIQRKRKTGTIRLAGRGAIFPDDIVTLPQYYSGEQYIVKSVRHTIDSDKAFMSTLKCGEAL